MYTYILYICKVHILWCLEPIWARWTPPNREEMQLFLRAGAHLNHPDDGGSMPWESTESQWEHRAEHL